MGEKLDAQVAQGALGHVDHGAGVEPGRQNADDIDDAHPQQGCCQRGKIGVLLLSHGHDVIVHQRLQKQAGLHVGQRADHDAHQNKDAVGR